MPSRIARGRAIVITASLLIVGSVIGGYYWWRQPKSSDHAHTDQTEKPASKIEEMRAQSVKVVPAEIEVYVKAPGIVDFHPKHALRIHPTFPGMVIRVNKNLGDTVNSGDVLATVESNVGVQDYAITSPIKGVVLSRNVGAGQSVSPEEEIFSVGDASVLQARLSVAARDIKKVRADQKVILVAENQRSVRSTLHFLSPILSEDTRTAPAIVDFGSAELRPGMFVTGAIVIETAQVAKSLPAAFCENDINSRALFVFGANGIENRDVTFGRRDYQNCEILQGLEVNEEVLPSTVLAMFPEKEADVHDD